MKHVFDAGTVAALWAVKGQTYAKVKHGNFYFEGATIYSYGSHFPIAYHTQDAHGKACVLFTTRTYSATTASHIACVRWTLNQKALRYFCVPIVHAKSKVDHAENYRYLVNDSIQDFIKAQRSRNWKDRLLESSLSARLTANKYSRDFKLGYRQLMELDIYKRGHKAIKAEKLRIKKAKRAKRLAEERRIAPFLAARKMIHKALTMTEQHIWANCENDALDIKAAKESLLKSAC